LDRTLYACAGIAGFLGVALGAFAAHGMRARLAPDLMAIFETGVRYHLLHVFAVVAAAWGWARWHHRGFVWAGGLFLAGIVVFSGSLYLLALTGTGAWGAITPLGGLAFLAGWLCLAWGARSRLPS
jgi:uncharacterized membrane protein YgdD (TMEM256/DUF423 family)